MTTIRRETYRINNRGDGSSQHSALGIGTTAAAIAVIGISSSSSWLVSGFTSKNCMAINSRQHHRQSANHPSSILLHVFAPPGSGYVRSTDIVDDEEDGTVGDADSSSQQLTSRDILQISPKAYPKTYEPMLEYPGTMRPGRTPENMPFHDLPFLGVNDPNPVPWPHFQEIEWHHKWEPPHEQALAMEEFIDEEGRWASVEDEAEMRMGMRRGVRERREMEEGGIGATRSVGGGGVGLGGAGGEQIVIMDDDDEEDDDGAAGGIGSNLGLGDGVKAFLKNPADAVSTARRSAMGDDDESELDDEIDDDDDILGDSDEGEDDFLLDLGLGGDVGDVDIDDDDEDILAEEEEETFPTKSALKMEASADDLEDDDDDDLDEEG
ncbi:hypothetical protein ACHAWU_004840 [Discostella pseudostelligera]|uniref:Uncharacterized protein n=1 Tax=Discostella pseudostelligera TaxID=259834 RepID=A0ABD3M3F6_9STRA